MQLDSIGVILLAAGASLRLGEPKQLLKFRGETLLRRNAKIARAVSNKVVVTLGARIEILRKEIEDLPVEIVENADWESGMSGSIRVGLKRLIDDKRLKAVIVMVCDQPFVDENLLKKIIVRFQETGAPVVACAYQNTLGVPAFFTGNFSPNCSRSTRGRARNDLIKKYEAQTAAIEFPEGAFDVDTQEDYENLLKISNSRICNPSRERFE
jgi:molybdenum cofactor cytidylyltransferase